MSHRKVEYALFAVGRYVSLGIQFVDVLLLGYFLTPFDFGVWAFLRLALQYSNYLDFGSQYALTNLLATVDQSDKSLAKKWLGVSLLLNMLSALLLFGIAVFSGIVRPPFMEKFGLSFEPYLVAAVSTVLHFNKTLVGVQRNEKRLFPVILFNLLPQLTILLVILIYRGRLSPVHAIAGQLVGLTCSLFYLVSLQPYRPSFTRSLNAYREFLTKGFSLLYVNLSSKAILLLPATVASWAFSVSQLGVYSLANNLAEGAALGVMSVRYALHPHILQRIATARSPEDYRSQMVALRQQLTILFRVVLVWGGMFAAVVLVNIDRFSASALTVFLLMLGLRQKHNSFLSDEVLLSTGREAKLGTNFLFAALTSGTVAVAVSAMSDSVPLLALSVLVGGTVSASLNNMDARKQLWPNQSIGHVLVSESLIGWKDILVSGLFVMVSLHSWIQAIIYATVLFALLHPREIRMLLQKFSSQTGRN